MLKRRSGTVAALGTAQTLAWASTYYLPAILAAPMARELGVSTSTVFAAFSVALIVSALVGPRAGAAIDRHGGRPVLMLTSIVFALGLPVWGWRRTSSVSLPRGWCWASAWAAGSTRRRSPRSCACTARTRAAASPASR